MGYDNWNNLVPKDLLMDIVQRLSCLEDYYRFSAVCKSWNSAASKAATSLADSVIAQKPWWLLLKFPTTTPMLLLAEEVAPGSIICNTEYDLNREYGYEEGYFKDDDDDDGDDIYDHLKNSVGTSRGLYSLSSTKTYNIELPEAAGKLILATSKGWLLTLGRDLQINLLHPLLRHQISLPPMLTFPTRCVYRSKIYTHEDGSDYFIRKVAMSSELPKNNTAVSFFNHHATLSPIVMVVYHHLGVLGFARLGDQVWTDVNVSSDYFHDIVYHKGNFYAVDWQGDVYVCCIDHDDERGGPRGTKIASIETEYREQKYLVEPLSGSGLLLLVRNNRDKFFNKTRGLVTKYRTTNFEVWRLDLEYCDSRQIPSCTLTRENNLGNEAIFVGRATSLSVPSSDVIKPNSVYFTDDNWEAFIRLGGGHDMGIFDLERRTVEPHYQGKSIHCISPPLWYI